MCLGLRGSSPTVLKLQLIIRKIKRDFRLGTARLETTAFVCLRIAALDRFNDFITGSNSVAIVREAIAQVGLASLDINRSITQ